MPTCGSWVFPTSTQHHILRCLNSVDLSTCGAANRAWLNRMIFICCNLSCMRQLPRLARWHKREEYPLARVHEFIPVIPLHMVRKRNWPKKQLQKEIRPILCPLWHHEEIGFFVVVFHVRDSSSWRGHGNLPSRCGTTLPSSQEGVSQPRQLQPAVAAWQVLSHGNDWSHAGTPPKSQHSLAKVCSMTRAGSGQEITKQLIEVSQCVPTSWYCCATEVLT